jgi:hypothetical protein
VDWALKLSIFCRRVSRVSGELFSTPPYTQELEKLNVGKQCSGSGSFLGIQDLDLESRSGSFHQKAKKFRKILILTVL